ncbi:MAG: pyridoxal-phosphate-dependent aminotransferase family protein [Vicinamibacterales bacterium]|jgi:alanine-glyoxylate transaminase/serine-glyoxylate transaminase/serine-pyruvate transaminase
MNTPENVAELDPPGRLLLGPGPSPVHPRVTRALAAPALGHLDPALLQYLQETSGLLRSVFRTQNPTTLAVSGTGMAGMEAVLGSLLEPGDRLVVCAAGFFGQRIAELAARMGVSVTKVEKEWGQVFTPEELETAVAAAKPKAVAIVHAETSTGALQPMVGLGAIAERHGALLIADCVTSLGGVPVEIDDWGVDAAYSGSQKCLGGPAGMSPVTLSPRARDAIRARKRPAHAWYLDLDLLERYWCGDHAYHHTISSALVYALREGLRLVVEEGLEARFERHQRNAQLLWDGLEAMGLTLHVAPEHRIPSLTTVRVPEGVDEARVRTRLREDYGIEIGAGLGPLKGKVFRIGLMGHGSQKANVTLLLAALADLLRRP